MILRRLPGIRFSEVLPEWAGQIVAIIGGGPSLTLDQVEQVRQHEDVRVIAVNDAYLWAPWADVSYFADASWWTQHAAGVAKPMLRLSAEQVRERFSAFAGEKCSIESQVGSIEDAAVHILRNFHLDPNGRGIHGFGLSLNPRSLVTGRHSGFQALNVAVLAGSRHILLLGIDGKPAADGRTHWSGGHKDPTPQDAYEFYRKAFSAAEHALKAAGVTVVNCSPGSAVDSFPKMPLEQALACLPLTA